jgi:hypothetical protein
MNTDPRLNLDDLIEGPEDFIEDDDALLEEDTLLDELDLDDADLADMDDN